MCIYTPIYISYATNCFYAGLLLMTGSSGLLYVGCFNHNWIKCLLPNAVIIYMNDPCGLHLASPFSIPGRFVLVPCDTELNNTDILIFVLNHKIHRTLLEVNVEENQPTKRHIFYRVVHVCVCVYWCIILICIHRLKTIFNDAMIVLWRPSPIPHFACLFLYLFHACDFCTQEKKHDFFTLMHTALSADV